MKRIKIPIQDVPALMKKIEGLNPVMTDSSLHIAEDRYVIDGELYAFYYGIGETVEDLPEVERLVMDASERKAAAANFTFFWKKDSCFSNWYHSPFKAPFPYHLLMVEASESFMHKIGLKQERNTLSFANTEQYMMFCKAILFKDFDIADQILKETNPSEIKKLGRNVKNFLEIAWINNRLDIMVDGCTFKFSQNDILRGQLLATGETTIAEASPVDSIWGIGYAEDHPNAIYPDRWNGLNLLGTALMKVRQRLKTTPWVKTTHLPWMSVSPTGGQRVALLIGRFNPLHRAHCWLIERMIQDNDVVLIGVGSAQESNTQRNPYSVNVRIAMLRNVFGDRIKVFPIRDLGTGIHTQEWINNVIGKCMELNLPVPNHYYCGCHDDSLWYQGYFSGSNPIKKQVGDELIYSHPSENRALHILERTATIYPSATRIREYINLRMDDWKAWVPVVNHVLVEANYPQEFRTAIEADHLDDTLPDGTSVIIRSGNDDEPQQVWKRVNGRWMNNRQSITLILDE